MRNIKKNIFFLLILILSIVFYISSAIEKESLEQKRARTINEISLSIEEAVKQGKYKCCINPPCTMCYLGNWIWKDGSCHCDEMITKGEFDKVCPECRRGLEEGKCKLINKTECKI